MEYSEVIITAITIILTSFFTTIGTYLITKYSEYKSKHRQLDERLEELNKISLTYPNLENKEFIKRFEVSKNKNTDEFIRYDSYCSLWFNYLESLAIFYNFDREKIHNFIYIKDIVQTHKYWWKLDENIDAYDKRFRKFMEEYIL